MQAEMEPYFCMGESKDRHDFLRIRWYDRLALKFINRNLGEGRERNCGSMQSHINCDYCIKIQLQRYWKAFETNFKRFGKDEVPSLSRKMG
jgi:hypothetical protein